MPIYEVHYNPNAGPRISCDFQWQIRIIIKINKQRLGKSKFCSNNNSNLLIIIAIGV